MVSTKDLAFLLDVSVHSLKKWRCLPKKDPQYLPAVPLEGGNPQHLFYDPETVRKWAAHRRNAKYQAKVIAALVPDEIRESLLPQALATYQANQLRGNTPPQVQPTNWSNIHEELTRATN